jgi:hypothetical protein
MNLMGGRFTIKTQRHHRRATLNNMSVPHMLSTTMNHGAEGALEFAWKERGTTMSCDLPVL